MSSSSVYFHFLRLCLQRHNVNVAVIQESKLSSNYNTPSIQNFTTVRKDHRQGQRGSLLTLINKSMNFSRNPVSLDTLITHHLEELTITTTLGNTEHNQCLHTPAGSMTGVQQQNSNYTHTHCELFHQTIHKHCHARNTQNKQTH